jgi:uncharacterized protein (TIGR02453 family)
MKKHTHLGPQLFDFLRDLRNHNDREWFHANKQRYERDVRDPLLAFIGDAAAPLARISREVLADPRPTGGSLFRVYRDTRFSKDKTPYKTHAAAQFRHRAGKDVHAPGFYVHLEPGDVFVGAGLWRPESEPLRAVRTAIATRPFDWKRVLAAPAFKKLCTLEGESAKRPPQGFDPDHALIDDIRRKDFIAVARFKEAEAIRPGFLDAVITACRAAAPLNAFICRALGHPW